MSNVTPLWPTRKVMMTVHQVTFDLVPREVVERVFHAAIAVAWASSDGEYTPAAQDAADRLNELEKAVNAASQYTVQVEREVDEPISNLPQEMK